MVPRLYLALVLKIVLKKKEHKCIEPHIGNQVHCVFITQFLPGQPCLKTYVSKYNF